MNQSLPGFDTACDPGRHHDPRWGRYDQLQEAQARLAALPVSESTTEETALLDRVTAVLHRRRARFAALEMLHAVDRHNQATVRWLRLVADDLADRRWRRDRAEEGARNVS